MSTVLTEPETGLAETDRHAFNVAVWRALADDRVLAGLDFRIETDRHGQILMSPPAHRFHAHRQGRLLSLLERHRPGGQVLPECPISTSEGVKSADVAWCSDAVWEAAGDAPCFTGPVPEICIEVLSPSNTRGEIEEKVRLYFEAGALEVWLCETDGALTFLAAPEARIGRSRLCPEFPPRIG